MNVLIFGEPGFLGRNLTKELISSGYRVSVITRNQKITASKVESDVS